MQLRQQKYPFGSLRRDPHWSTKGLVFFSQFRPAGMLFDESLHGNHGTIVGATWVGDHLSFDGGNRVETPDILNTANLTVITWVRFDVGYRDWIVNKESKTAGRQWQLLYYGGKINASITNASGDIAVADFTWSPDTTKWYQIAFTTTGIDGGPLTLYLDGVEIASDTLSANMDLGSTFIRFGQAVWDDEPSVLDLNGDIKQALIYNRTQSTTEIAELYRTPDLPFQEDVSWMGMVEEEEPVATVGWWGWGWNP